MGLGRCLSVLGMGLGLTFGGVKGVEGNELRLANAQTTAFCKKLGDKGTISPNVVGEVTRCAISGIMSRGFPYANDEIVAKARQGVEVVRKGGVKSGVTVECTMNEELNGAPSYLTCRVVDVRSKATECITNIENASPGKRVVTVTCTL